jgi:hypothetical protein
MKPRMLSLCVVWLLLIVCARSKHPQQDPVDCSSPSSALSSWMTCLFPLISNLTILDLQLPGTHDTLTFHLSDRIADNANDISPALAAFLHDVVRPPIAFVGSFIKSMAITQRLNLLQQLDAGIRFLDLRCTFSRPPAAAVTGQQERVAEQWVGLHFVETLLAFTEYLTDIRSWLDAHPRELVVLSVTRHGDFCLNGPGQFPGCDQNEKDALWQAMTATFNGLLVNHSQGLLNETTLQQLLDRGQRVVACADPLPTAACATAICSCASAYCVMLLTRFTGDYSSLTRSSTLALDACLINNVCLQDVTDVQASARAIMSFLSELRELRATSKRNNTFVLLSLADAVSNDMYCIACARCYLRLSIEHRIKLNALIMYDPLQVPILFLRPQPSIVNVTRPHTLMFPSRYNPQRQQHLLACAALFKFPNASAAWCPRNLSDISLTAAYYNQVHCARVEASFTARQHLIYLAAVPRRRTQQVHPCSHPTFPRR